MKLFLDFLPIVIFFAVYKFTGDIIIATAVLIPRHRTGNHLHLD